MVGTALFVRVRRGEVKGAGGTPAVRNGRVAIEIMLGLLGFCVLDASNQSQKRRPEASGTKDTASIGTIAGGANSCRSQPIRRQCRAYGALPPIFLRSQPSRAGLTSVAPTALSCLPRFS
jgi:hypothetical protein